jgi:hypothetical protein
MLSFLLGFYIVIKQSSLEQTSITIETQLERLEAGYELCTSNDDHRCNAKYLASLIGRHEYVKDLVVEQLSGEERRLAILRLKHADAFKAFYPRIREQAQKAIDQIGVNDQPNAKK